MKKLITLSVLLFCTLALNSRAQSTAFTYQGRLADGGAAATGVYDIGFELFGAATGGSGLSDFLIQPGVPVSNGLFTVQLDLGSALFNGSERWLEIHVRSNGSASAFTMLAPRQ